MEKQPNSRICFACVIDAPACTWPSPPTMKGAASPAPAPGPGPSARAIRVICTAGSSAPYWASQLRFLYTLAFSLVDRVLPVVVFQ
jgi:hypothetical protein